MDNSAPAVCTIDGNTGGLTIRDDQGRELALSARRGFELAAWFIDYLQDMRAQARQERS